MIKNPFKQDEPKTPGQAPIIVTLPNTTDKKMEALINVSEAIKEVAKALNSVNTQVTVRNCNFTNSPSIPGGSCISINTKDS